MTHARPDMGRRPRNGVEGDEAAQDNDTKAAAGDLYDMPGNRATRTSTITSQQWLALRLIKL